MGGQEKTMAPLPGAGDDLSVWPGYSKGLPCSSESHGVCWEGKSGRAPELGQRAGGASGTARGSPSSMARVKLCMYDEVFDF